MITMAYDVPFGLAVVLFSGHTNTDEDYEGYLAGIDIVKGMHETWLPSSGPICAIGYMDPNNPVPDARWRKRIALASKGVNANTTFLLVSESALVRGTVTALQWVTPLPFEVVMVATFEQAVTVAEKRRGVGLPLFRSLLREARDRTTTGERYARRVTRSKPA